MFIFPLCRGSFRSNILHFDFILLSSVHVFLSVVISFVVDIPPLAEIDGGHRRRNSKGIRQANSFYVTYGKNVLSAQILEVSPLGVGPVLRLERNAWSIVK